MQRQYNEIKTKHPKDIVLFRLGDFYEAFNEDANTISHVLGITLTGRGKGENRIPMAGIPHHALDNYLPKLVKAGHKVALVDQTTEPKPGQLVEREVSKIFTAGTLTEENTLSESENNYLVSIYFDPKAKSKKKVGAAICDVSTGKLQVFETSVLSEINNILTKMKPAEIIMPQSQSSEAKQFYSQGITPRDDSEFEYKLAYDTSRTQFGTTNLKGFGIEDMNIATSALGALITYLKECQRTELEHLKQVSIYQAADFMHLDLNTIRNLEIVFPAIGNDLTTTVYTNLNGCNTNMGKRKLREWLLHPLLLKDRIQERLDATETFVHHVRHTGQVREYLKNVADIERIVGRIGVGSANARDLLALSSSLEHATKLISELGSLDVNELPIRIRYLLDQIGNTELIDRITELINTSINPDPPAVITEGGIIASGYNTEVDELRSLKQGGKSTLAGIRSREIERTGIPSLKVGYNKVFGYYIEITKTHSHKAPEDYIRKQTLTNAERYITQELKDWEEKILSAEEKLMKLEYELFVGIRSQIAENSLELLQIADCIGELDVFANFGHIARQRQYCKPLLNNANSRLEIKEGRHLVVEQLQEEFTPNDTKFDNKQSLILLTGPNMSGKSTYIRQVALIVLLAQVGSFVPATEMNFQLYDQIFTRVGAADNLSQGESTFMVEMNETANILNNATEKSLIILDEVGRGTSTYDGVAIAWAVVEHIQEKIKANTLFATHYHELIELEKKYSDIKNYHVQVIEKGDEVFFQHKIASGSTSKSYGIHVAEMAGVPEKVVKKAEKILDQFESSNGKKKTSKSPQRPRKISPEQLGLMSYPK